MDQDDSRIFEMNEKKRKKIIFFSTLLKSSNSLDLDSEEIQKKKNNTQKKINSPWPCFDHWEKKSSDSIENEIEGLGIWNRKKK